jgi:xanthine/uracil permease
MGLIVLSIMISIILGCCVWLALGDRFPAGNEQKWPALNNIVCYGVILVIPVYLVIFFTF